MKKDKKKQKIRGKILEILNQRPAGRRHIQKALGKSASEWILKSLLADLLKEKIIISEGRTSSLVYKISAQGRQQSFLMDPPVRAEDIPNLESLSAYMPYLKRYFSYPPNQRGTKGYDRQRLNGYKPNKSRLLSTDKLDIMQSTISWGVDEALGATYDNEVISKFLKYFTFNSARLEGSSLSFGATVEVLDHPERFKDDEEKIIIINHGRAVDWLVKCIRNPQFEIEKELSVNSKPIKELHMSLMNGLLPGDTEGEIRQRGVEISLSTYIPTTDVEVLETDLNEIAIKAMAIKDVYERAFFLLLHISYLQAFNDGNKRTARLISNLPLISARRTPHAFVEVDEDSYHNAIVFYYENGDHRPLEQLWFESYIEGARLFDSLRKDYRSANLPKVELTPLKILAIRMIVEHKEKRRNYKKRCKEIFEGSPLAKKYDLETFQAMVVTACDKLAKNRLGGSIYSLTEEQIDQWAEIWS